MQGGGCPICSCPASSPAAKGLAWGRPLPTSHCEQPAPVCAGAQKRWGPGGPTPHRRTLMLFSGTALPDRFFLRLNSCSRVLVGSSSERMRAQSYPYLPGRVQGCSAHHTPPDAPPCPAPPCPASPLQAQRQKLILCRGEEQLSVLLVGGLQPRQGHARRPAQLKRDHRRGWKSRQPRT